MLFKRCKCEISTQAKCLHPFWYRFEALGKAHRASTHTANRQTAARIELKKRSEIVEAREGLTPKKIVRLEPHIHDYLAYTKLKNKTAERDPLVLASFLKIVKDRPLHQVESTHIEAWKTFRASEVERSTVNRELNIVRGCFSRAVEWKRLIASPCTVVKNFKVDDERIRVLNSEELRVVMSLPKRDVVLLCRTTLESLARLSEVLTLRVHHIGPPSTPTAPSWVEMKKKGGRVMKVPITDALRAALLACAHPVSGYVFGIGVEGHLPERSAVSQRVIDALKTAGIHDASHHTMRHTGVTLMLDQGRNVRAIQKLAGWSSLRMLERYGHVRDAETLNAIRGVASHLDDIGASITVESRPLDGSAQNPSQRLITDGLSERESVN